MKWSLTLGLSSFTLIQEQACSFISMFYSWIINQWGWWLLTSDLSRSDLVSHGGGAAGSASGDEAAGLSQGAVHPIPGALQAAKQTHPARRDPCQGHAGNTHTHSFIFTGQTFERYLLITFLNKANKYISQILNYSFTNLLCSSYPFSNCSSCTNV